MIEPLGSSAGFGADRASPKKGAKQVHKNGFLDPDGES
jgi:hypothetical protein